MKDGEGSEICRLLMLAGFCLALISMGMYGYIMNNQKGLLRSYVTKYKNTERPPVVELSIRVPHPKLRSSNSLSPLFDASV